MVVAVREEAVWGVAVVVAKVLKVALPVPVPAPAGHQDYQGKYLYLPDH